MTAEERIRDLENRVRELERKFETIDASLERLERQGQLAASRLEQKIQDVEDAGTAGRNYLSDQVRSLEGDVRSLENRVD